MTYIHGNERMIIDLFAICYIYKLDEFDNSYRALFSFIYEIQIMNVYECNQQIF